MGLQQGSPCPQTDVSVKKMLRLVQMSAMRKLHCGVGLWRERQVRAEYDSRGFLLSWQRY